MTRLTTLLHAWVPRERWPALTRAYEELVAETVPPGLEETALSLARPGSNRSFADAPSWSAGAGEATFVRIGRTP